ncbi:MAG: hypothetical protein CM1200mP18_23270 [Gammaproteobacteria bacterium]|nr:MAG: hypothetical protein CM1200mP18_23270 [Gammaproteobacteria bacterium]
MVIPGFLPATAVGQLFFGPFSDRFGAHTVAGWSRTVSCRFYPRACGDGSVCSGSGPLRQGVGAAAAMVLSRVIINDTQHRELPLPVWLQLCLRLRWHRCWRSRLVVCSMMLLDGRVASGLPCCWDRGFYIGTDCSWGDTRLSAESVKPLGNSHPQLLGLLRNKQFLLFAGNLGFQASIFFALFLFFPLLSIDWVTQLPPSDFLLLHCRSVF